LQTPITQTTEFNSVRFNNLLSSFTLQVIRRTRKHTHIHSHQLQNNNNTGNNIKTQQQTMICTQVNKCIFSYCTLNTSDRPKISSVWFVFFSEKKSLLLFLRSVAHIYPKVLYQVWYLWVLEQCASFFCFYYQHDPVFTSSALLS
jgi:hypothetical protein